MGWDGLLAETGRRSPVRATRSGRCLFVCCRVCSQTPYRSVAICLGVGIGCLAGVMRRSVSFGEEFRRIQRGSSLPFGSAPRRICAVLQGRDHCAPGAALERVQAETYDSKWSRHIGDGNTENGTWMGVTCLSCFDWLCLSRRDDIGWRTDPSHPMRQSISFAQSAEICHSMVHLNPVIKPY